MRRVYLFAIVAAWATSATAITIDTVPIGDSGNLNDRSSVGGVANPYRIGKFEVTIGQYTAFLNAVAATDTYGLYTQQMLGTAVNGSPANSGISRSGAPGSYTYSVFGSPQRPVTYVSWGDTARFVNWLHNDQLTGPQGPATTEDGAYFLNGALTSGDLARVTRMAGARWFLPTESEWHKAAYYQPTRLGGDVDGYWRFPTRSNEVPFSDQPPGNAPDNTSVGNFNYDDGLDNGFNDGYAAYGSAAPHVPREHSVLDHLTDVGAYSYSPSYYGTFDQGGNAHEWTESLLISFETRRVLRGGGWGSSPFFSGSSEKIGVLPAFDGPSYGFRVATLVPEPTSLGLLSAGGLAMLAWRRRRA